VKIALVHPFAWPDVVRGGERYLHDLGWYLASAGHDVHIVTGTTAGTPSVDEVDGVRVIRSPYKRHHLIGRAGLSVDDSFGMNALLHLSRERYDLVHALRPASALAGRLSGHPTIYTDIGLPNRLDLRERAHAWQLFRAATAMATERTALSKAAAARVESLCRRPVTVIHPGVRTDLFAPRLEARSGPLRILFASDRDEPRKGVQFLLAALDRVLDHQPAASVVMAGPGDHRWALDGLGSSAARVAAAIEDLGVASPQRLIELYRTSTVTVLPSAHEAFGLVLVESLACGTPVVCSDQGGMPEIVHDQRIGCVAAHADAGELARALVLAGNLAALPGTPARCANHARRWDWRTQIGPDHEQLYARVLTRVRPRRGGSLRAS
jgi:glycosyltransferase involved in cell wall biosynthesis